MIAAIGYVDVALAVNTAAVGAVQSGFESAATITLVTLAAAGDGGDQSGAGLERPGGFKSQRQLMSGGVCEASAFALYGYKTTGLAFPLGNYHNGAPGDAIGAEYIHRDDFIGGVELMVEAAQQVANRDTTNFRQRIGPVSEEFRRRLQGKV